MESEHEAENREATSDIKPCKVCGNSIFTGATKCTHCNEYQNFRRHLNFPQHILALLIALISVSTVLIPILRNSKTPLTEDRVKFTWLFATDNAITLLLHNDSDEDAFIQEIFFIHPDSSHFYVDRLNRRPVIPKNAITPYEINVFGQSLQTFLKDSKSLTLWIYWRSAAKEYAYTLTFCDGACDYSLDRLSPLLTTRYESNELSVMSDLYFGKDTPDGPVSPEAWQHFKDSVLSKYFEAYTELPATGSWTSAKGTLVHENTSVIRILHSLDSKNFEHIEEVATAYKIRFKQESVLITRTDYVQGYFK